MPNNIVRRFCISVTVLCSWSLWVGMYKIQNEMRRIFASSYIAFVGTVVEVHSRVGLIRVRARVRVRVRVRVRPAGELLRQRRFRQL